MSTEAPERAGPARFHPPPEPTTRAAAHESPYGRIESAWRVVDGRLQLRVVVPAGTEAAVVLPDGTTHSAGPGEHSYTSTLPEENAR